MGDDLRCYRAVSRPRFSLVCLPHAGGNATAFRDWPAYLPEDVAVYAARYPGRLDRLREPAARTVAELADPKARAARSVPHPAVLFGHSMGAVAAHDLTAPLQRTSPPPPAPPF